MEQLSGMKKVYEKYIVCSDCEIVCSTHETDLKLHILFTHVKKPNAGNLNKRKLMKQIEPKNIKI